MRRPAFRAKDLVNDTKSLVSEQIFLVNGNKYSFKTKDLGAMKRERKLTKRSYPVGLKLCRDLLI